MYLMPWQIFVLGCICGICISIIVGVIILIRLAFRGGVKVVEHKVRREERNEDGRE